MSLQDISYLNHSAEKYIILGQQRAVEQHFGITLGQQRAVQRVQEFSCGICGQLGVGKITVMYNMATARSSDPACLEGEFQLSSISKR